jgi:hypothetical protein
MAAHAVRKSGSALKVVLAGAVLVVAPACAPLEGAVGGLPGSRTSLVSGEIRSVDTRRGEIQVRSNVGRTHNLRYDSRTRVVYQSRQYSASALERGDVVRVTVSQDRNGRQWAERVDVRESVSARRGVSGRVERLDGNVGQVDARRGQFTVVRRGQPTVLVYVSNRAPRDDIRRFERLRRGERVRVDVRAVNRSTAELVRFR